jgi:Fe-S cluster assembly scaffold protein SufB
MSLLRRIEMPKTDLIDRLYASIGETCSTDPSVAHIEIHGNQVLGVHLVPGLEVDARENREGIEAQIQVQRGYNIEHPVRICFGLLPEKGVQRITLKIRAEDESGIAVYASCSFPNAAEVLHAMDAEISVGKNARYAYIERHVHSPSGGVQVQPKSRVTLAEGARFRTDFELLKGLVGDLHIDYEAECGPRSVLEMAARVSGRGKDRIYIDEKARLTGERSRAVLSTSIAVRDTASAEVKNTIIADAPRARGHVDCKEIVKDHARANAVPVVQVNDPLAHVTHEAAIGSVDSKQLETLMSRGLNEDDATDLIIEGLLSPSY